MQGTIETRNLRRFDSDATALVLFFCLAGLRVITIILSACRLLLSLIIQHWMECFMKDVYSINVQPSFRFEFFDDKNSSVSRISWCRTDGCDWSSITIDITHHPFVRKIDWRIDMTWWVLNSSQLMHTAHPTLEEEDKIAIHWKHEKKSSDAVHCIGAHLVRFE